MLQVEENRQKEKFACKIEGCQKVYSRQDSLKCHQKKDHQLDDIVKDGRFVCSSCERKFYHAVKLVQHCEKEHKLHIDFKTREFSSWVSFLAWKEEEECITYSYFVQVKGELEKSSESTGRSRSVLYVCCRDGTKAQAKSHQNITGQKRKIINDTRKLGNFCVARMTATENLENGKVNVVYISSHCNHVPGIEECKYLPLPPSVKKHIQQQFVAGVSLERIIDEIRGNIGCRQNRDDFENAVTRKHFISRQDTRNACRKIRDFAHHRHTDDAVSVDRLVTELNTEVTSPILFYKPQGIKDPNYPMLTSEGFLLVMMTSFQASLFTEFSSKIVCIDSTHKTNEYRFKLITLVVPDEYCNGQPVAWAISDREDIETLKVVWTFVKKSCPEASVNTLMTDDDLVGAGACSHAYPNVCHLLCRWHVDRAWQRKLHSTVKDKHHQAELYACLWLLLSEEDIDIFLSKQEIFIDYWQTKEPDFVTYYKNEYSKRAEQWAMCYRHFDHSFTDTNMLVESFHNKLKTNPRYLNKHANRRCDDLIQILLKIEEDMFFERKKKEIMGTAANASLKVEGEQRHIHGRDIPNSNTSSISDCTYEVKSMESARTYNVQVIASHCSGQPDCVPQCTNEECKYLCRHMIQCTCVDYGHGHLCKHAHKIQILQQSNCHEQEQMVAKDPLDMIIPPLQHRTGFDIAGKRRTIKAYLGEIQSGMDSLEDPDSLDRVLTLLIQANAAITSANEAIKCINGPLPQSFEKKDKFKPRQKNETQASFKKTTRSPGRRKTPTIVKPRQQQQKDLWSNMEDQLRSNVTLEGETTANSSSEVLHSPQALIEVDNPIDRLAEGTISQPETVPELNYIESEQQSVTVKRKRKRCGECEGCQALDCRKCTHCLDMLKYGGTGRKKKACVLRKCTVLH